MATINANYDRLSAGYLFPEIARRTNAFAARNPGVELLRLGIGNTTEPLSGCVIGGLRVWALGRGLFQDKRLRAQGERDERRGEHKDEPEGLIDAPGHPGGTAPRPAHSSTGTCSRFLPRRRRCTCGVFRRCASASSWRCSFVAFVIWVFGMGGPFSYLSWYGSYAYVGGLLMIAYTLGVALIDP